MREKGDEGTSKQARVVLKDLPTGPHPPLLAAPASRQAAGARAAFCRTFLLSPDHPTGNPVAQPMIPPPSKTDFADAWAIFQPILYPNPYFRQYAISKPLNVPDHG